MRVRVLGQGCPQSVHHNSKPVVCPLVMLGATQKILHAPLLLLPYLLGMVPTMSPLTMIPLGDAVPYLSRLSHVQIPLRDSTAKMSHMNKS